MDGTHDRGLVLACYCVVAVALYVAFDLGSRSAALENFRRRLWLIAAALAVAAGLWAANLLGIKAFALPGLRGFGGLWLALSWLAALASAAAALYMVAVKPASVRHAAAAVVVLGGGLTVLHWSGVASLSLAPAAGYALAPAAVALLLAAGAAALMLTVASSLRNYAWPGIAPLHIAAALVVGAAICAAQYAFLHAVQVPRGAAAAADLLIPGRWVGWPLALVAAGLMIIVVLLSLMEAHAIAERRASERRRAEAESIRRITYFDAVTGLPNRSQFNEALLRQLISVNGRTPPPFGVLHTEFRSYTEVLGRLGQERMNRLMKQLAQQLAPVLRTGDLLARLSHDSFVLLLRERSADEMQASMDAVAELLEAPLQEDGQWLRPRWALGYSHYPDSGNSTRALLRAAMKPQREVGVDSGADSANDHGHSRSTFIMA